MHDAFDTFSISITLTARFVEVCTRSLDKYCISKIGIKFNIYNDPDIDSDASLNAAGSRDRSVSAIRAIRTKMHVIA